MIMMTSRATGTITRVPHGRIVEVFLHRAAGADQRRDSAREVAQSVAKYLHARERRLQIGIVVEGDVDLPDRPVLGPLRLTTAPTPSIASRRSRTAARSASVARPPSARRGRRSARGAPCGNDSPSTSKPSTLSTDFLKNPAIE